MINEEQDLQLRIYEKKKGKGRYPTNADPSNKVNEEVQTQVNGETNLKKESDTKESKQVPAHVTTTKKKPAPTSKTTQTKKR